MKSNKTLIWLWFRAACRVSQIQSRWTVAQLTDRWRKSSQQQPGAASEWRQRLNNNKIKSGWQRAWGAGFAMANQGGCDSMDASKVEPVVKSPGDTSSRPLSSGEGGEMAEKEEEEPSGVRHPADIYPLCRVSKLINWKRPLWTSAFFATTNIAFWWDTWRSKFLLHAECMNANITFSLRHRNLNKVLQ